MKRLVVTVLAAGALLLGSALEAGAQGPGGRGPGMGNPEEMAIALEVARRSIVLLKNEQLLPIDLKRTKRILVVGENAVTKMALGGVGAGVKTNREITPLEGLQTLVGNQAKITYVPGYKSFTRELRAKRQEPQQPADKQLLAEAVKAAKRAAKRK